MTLLEKQKEYARLIVETGLNIQKGQPMVVSCPVEAAPFARLCAAAAYERGCSEVVMRWRDDAITRETYLHGADEIFDEFPGWQKDYFDYYDRKHAVYLSIHSEDPENLTGVDPDRIQRAGKVSGDATREHSARLMRDDFSWCVAGVPCAAWAKKVFPGKSEEDAVSALWDAILSTVYVTGEKPAEQAWEEHTATLSQTAEKLNRYQFETLHYENSLGTDLYVGLCKDHRWDGGAENNKDGIRFVANMPTEEVFTAPKRDAVNGVVCASKPLCYNGTLIQGIRFTLKDGKIIHADADRGLEVLKNAIAVDEGASYFGEAALVPYDSPISNLNLLFYNTLYDENAACHFAFGAAYSCLQHADEMTEEELRAAGINESATHVDFMVGTADLAVTGILPDGTEVPVMRNGNFVL